jgi:uncharacterized protein
VSAARAWLQRHIRAVIICLVLAVAALSALVAIAWHFSSLVLVPDHLPWSERVEIEAVSADRIELDRSEAALRPGYYGLAWESGHAVVGPVLGETSDTVTRRLSDVRGYLQPSTETGFESNVYSGDPREARGLPFETVDIHAELGPMPAWFVPAPGRTWAIVVHGINDDPEVGMRLAPQLHQLGLPSLLITYREDLGAPSSPDGYHHMGLTEWRDLQAAVRYALNHGAGRLVLVGYSMGGSLVTQFMQNSALAGDVSHLVLDAPALDWQAILEFNSKEMGLPGFLSMPVEWAIGARIDADWDNLNALQHTEDLRLPILLFHGTEDDVIPIATSEELAAKLPGWVTFFTVPRAGHTQSWNVDPTLYEHRLTEFLGQPDTN